MKKLLVLGLLASCTVMLTGVLWFPGSAHAQGPQNEIGIYTDLSADPASTSIFVEPFELFYLYLLVTNPVNEEYVEADCVPPVQQDMTWIDAVQFRMLKSGVGLYTLEVTPIGPSTSNIGELPDYAFGFEDPVPVPDNMILHLVTFTFMTADSDPKELFLEPTISLNHNFLGVYDALEYVAWPRDCPWDGPYQSFYPVSGDHAHPVFGVNTSVVATENASFGSVKALFR